jgi:hypothetical protein
MFSQMSDIQQADFPFDCPCFDQLIEIMSDIAETAAKWNGFGHFKKTLLFVSVKSGASLASKYQEIFSLKFALLDRVERDLMNAVIVSTFEGIGKVQDKLTSFNQSNEIVMSDIVQQEVTIARACVCVMLSVYHCLHMYGHTLSYSPICTPLLL